MKEALKLALEALEWCHGGEPCGTAEAITAIKAALAQQKPWCMKMNGCETKCEDCPVEVVEQEPVNAWLIFDKDNEPLIVSSDWVTTKKYKEAGRRVEQLAYYTTPPQQKPWCMKMNGCTSKCEDCPVEVAQQEPVAIKRMKEWIEYLKRKSDFGQHMKIPCEISAGTCWELAIELEQFINTTPPQPEERNFCPRCGKRTADLTVIHTCTPPQQDQETVFFGVKDQGVKVSSLEFVTRVMGKEEVIGKPIFWAEWPSKEPK